MRAGTLLLGLLLVPAVGVAQVVPRTELPFDAPESWAMKYFTAVSMVTSFGPPPAIRPGSVRLGLEAGYIPSLSERERTVGFGGTKEEDLNKLWLWARPRLTIGLPARISFTLSGVPPIGINGVQSALIAGSLARPVVEAGAFSAGLTINGQFGRLEGDFTCTGEQAVAGPNAELNPFGCEAPSRDVMKMNYFGAELSAGYRFDVLHGVTPNLAFAVNYADTQFQVNARYGGITDRTSLATDGVIGYGTLGLTLGLTPFLNLSGQAFFAPLTVQRPPDQVRRLDGLITGRLYLEWKVT